MSRYKIVISDYYYPDQKIENEVYQVLGDDVEIIDCTKLKAGGFQTPEELMPYVKDCDALIIQFAHITKELIDSMEKCRVISKYSIGVDTVDVQAATEKGIWVSNVPDYCIDEAADTAVAHILNAARKLSRAQELTAKGQFSMTALRPVLRLSESTILLIGFGRIARNAALKLKPFFRRILAADPYFTAQEDWPFVEFTTLEEALPQADVVSLFAPLTSETFHMLSEAAFEKMKDGVLLTNTARGALIDEQALVRALDSGKVAFAGLDLIEGSEDFEHSPLLLREDVCLTPHIAWLSESAQAELQRKTAENAVSALLTGKPVYHVNEIGEDHV